MSKRKPPPAMAEPQVLNLVEAAQADLDELGRVLGRIMAAQPLLNDPIGAKVARLALLKQVLNALSISGAEKEYDKLRTELAEVYERNGQQAMLAPGWSCSFEKQTRRGYTVEPGEFWRIALLRMAMPPPALPKVE